MSVTQPRLGPYNMGQPAGPRHSERAQTERAQTERAQTERAQTERAQTERHRAEQDRLRWQWEAELNTRWLRGEVASRLELFSLRHAEHAWRLRHSFGIAATAVALLYLDPSPRPQVRLAGKLLPDTDQVVDAGRVLYDLCGVTQEAIAAGLDPREQLSENPDPMSDRAAYGGVAVSLLDTPAGTWREVRTLTSGGGLFIPGRVLAVLGDGTMLLADRLEHHQPEHYLVCASQRLDPAWGGLGRVVRYTPELTELADPATRPLWLRLRELHSILAGATHGQ